MTREEARQILATWLVSSKGAKGQRGYIEGWFDEEDVEAFRMAIEALKAEAVQGWIPVSERLPDAEYGEGDSVLCCTESGLMYILYWNGGNWCVPTGEPHHWVNYKTGWHDKVIAWQPLPAPYKGGDTE